MAGNAFTPIEVIDLTHVWGGTDKQTEAAKAAIAQATSAMQNVAKSVAPKDDPVSSLVMQMMNHRRSGSGPTPAPALPPTSSLTR